MTSAESASINQIPNWSEKIAGENDPTNREIMAYQFGKEDGKNEEAESGKRLFFTNLEMCCYYSSRFYDYLTKEKQTPCELATIKAESINKFQALFLIDFNQYKDKQLRADLFKAANDFRSALKVKDVCLEINLLATTEGIDKSEIFNDGFYLQYNVNG